MQFFFRLTIASVIASFTLAMTANLLQDFTGQAPSLLLWSLLASILLLTIAVFGLIATARPR